MRAKIERDRNHSDYLRKKARFFLHYDNARCQHESVVQLVGHFPTVNLINKGLEKRSLEMDAYIYK